MLFSQRQAATLAGVTRAATRSAAGDGLVPNGHCSLADVVVLRASAVLRSLLFPGESQPAATAKQARPRDLRVRDLVQQLVRDDVSAATCVLVFPDDAVVVADQGTLVTRVLAAQSAGEVYLVLPIGSWIDEISRRVGERPLTSP